MRRTEYKGLFNFAVLGPNIPHAELASDREALLKTFRTITGRSDLKFGEITWVSHFRLADTVRKVEAAFSRLFTDSPNIRMVNKFGEGRVFVAGGL